MDLSVRGLGLLELRLQLWQASILQLGDCLPVPFALGRLHRDLETLDLFLDVLRALHLGLFRLPDLFQVGVLPLELEDLFLDQRQALAGRFVLLLLHRFALDLELDQPPLELVHLLRLGVDLHLDACRGLVDQVDGLVGQEPVGDVAVRELGRGDDRRVGDLDTMMQLVLLLQTAQDGDGVLDRGLVHQYSLEAALQGGVLLDVLAVFVERGRAHAVQLAPGERRFEHVAGVDGAFGLPGAHHGVDLVDEHDGAPFVLGDVLEHGLQAFLELPTVLRAGQQCRHVQGQHALVLESFRNLAVDDPLRQAFDDGGLAHAGLADEHGVVLGPPLQDLDRTADLVVAADHGVQFALPRALGQVKGVLLQGFTLPFCFLAANVLAAADRLDRLLQMRPGRTLLLQQAAGLPLVLEQGKQEQLRGDELVATLLRFLLGQIQKIRQFPGDVHLAAVACHLGEALDRRLQRIAQGIRIDAGLGEQRAGPAILLLHQGQQQVHRLDVGVVLGDGQALGVGERLLELGSELVEAHVALPEVESARQMRPPAADFNGVPVARKRAGCHSPNRIWAVSLPLHTASARVRVFFLGHAGNRGYAR